MKDEHVFYAGIHNPVEIRRDLLLAQKDILDSLKKHEHLRSLRAEKDMMMSEFRKRLGALKLITNKLRSVLPAHAIRAPAPEQPRVVSAPARKEVKERKSKLQLLEDELSRIESKLSSLE
jgi:hypothetical protein